MCRARAASAKYMQVAAICLCYTNIPPLNKGSSQQQHHNANLDAAASALGIRLRPVDWIPCIDVDPALYS